MNAKRRVTYIKDLMTKIGLEQDRLRMFQMSSAQAARFAEAAREMAEQVEKLGPSPLRSSPQVKQENQAGDAQPVEKNIVDELVD